MNIRKSENIPVDDLFLCARSFHNAAKKLAAALDLDSGPITEADISPLVFMYRGTLELYLKAIVLGAGGNFLVNKLDPLSVYRTRSVSWLAQFMCQIVTAVQWEEEFRCDGIVNLADFRALVNSMSAEDPGSHTFRLPFDHALPSGVREFVRKMNALLDLLDSTRRRIGCDVGHAHGRGGDG